MSIDQEAELFVPQVVKSRIQGATPVPGQVPKYNWTYPAYVRFPQSKRHILTIVGRLLTIMREEGPAALYKGFTPKVLRLAPGGGVLLLVVEFTLGVFRKGMFDRLLHVQSLICLCSFGSTIYMKSLLVIPGHGT